MLSQEQQEKIDIRNHINHNPKTNNQAHGQYKITCLIVREKERRTKVIHLYQLI